MRDTEFLKNLEERVGKTIDDYGLITTEDNVLVAVSGGKDSTTALYILNKLGYSVEGLIIDQLLGDYSKKNLENIKTFCKETGIKLHVVAMREEYGYSVCYMQSVLEGRGKSINSCTICGVIRRNILNRKAREYGATKIATGHNMDDEAQTILMNYIQGDMKRSARMGPISGSVSDDRFIPRIKPLYFCKESEIERYSKANSFPVVYDPCPCSCDSMRTGVKTSLNNIEKIAPGSMKSLLAGFLKHKQILEGQVKDKIIGSCDLCGEPTSNDVCRTCDLINIVANKNFDN